MLRAYPSVIEFRDSNGFSGVMLRPDHIARMPRPDDVIAPARFYIRIDYPLENPVKIAINEPNPVTRRRFIELVYREYSRLYQEDDESRTFPQQLTGSTPKDISEFLHGTPGVHGIYAHDLRDLALNDARLWHNNVYHLGVSTYFDSF